MSKIRLFLLCISIIFFIFSLEALIYSSRHDIADGYHPLYVASSFIDSVDNFWAYIPAPAPSYFPEITILYLLKLIFPVLKDWQYIAIANLSICLILLVFLVYFYPLLIKKNLIVTNTKIYLNKTNQILYTSIIFFTFTLLNFFNIGSKTILWIDGLGDHSGAYLITFFTILLIFLKKTYLKKSKLTFLIILICSLLGFFSDRLLVISTAVPLLLILFFIDFQKKKGRCNFDISTIDKYFYLLIFILASFIPYFIFNDFEVSKRHIYSSDYVFIYFDKLYGLVLNNFQNSFFQMFVFSFFSCIILITTIKNYKNFLSQFAILSLAVVFLSLIFLESFRGWNFRYFATFFFVGLLCLMLLKKKTLFGLSLFLFISCCYAIFNHQFNFDKMHTREFKLSQCIEKNNLNNQYSFGLSGHWDAVPINYYLERNLITKARISISKISLHQWMVNHNLNRLDKPFNFIIISPLNKWYGYDEYLKDIDGYKKTISCKGTKSKILLFNPSKLRKHFKLEPIN